MHSFAKWPISRHRCCYVVGQCLTYLKRWCYCRGCERRRHCWAVSGRSDDVVHRESPRYSGDARARSHEGRFLRQVCDCNTFLPLIPTFMWGQCSLYLPPFRLVIHILTRQSLLFDITFILSNHLLLGLPLFLLPRTVEPHLTVTVAQSQIEFNSANTTSVIRSPLHYGHFCLVPWVTLIVRLHCTSISIALLPT